MNGRQRWFFPDAERPPHGGEDIFGHESIIVLNPNDSEAQIKVTLWYTDRNPDSFSFVVAPQRVRCLRSNERDDYGGIEIPVEVQYAIGLESNVPVIAQYGRLDVRQANMAFYTTPGYAE